MREGVDMLRKPHENQVVSICFRTVVRVQEEKRKKCCLFFPLLRHRYPAPGTGRSPLVQRELLPPAGHCVHTRGLTVQLGPELSSSGGETRRRSLCSVHHVSLQGLCGCVSAWSIPQYSPAYHPYPLLLQLPLRKGVSISGFP